MDKFWNWAMAPDGSRELRLEGVLADEVWFGDEVTPAMFREELYGGTGPVSVWINSYGGDVMAGGQIYNMIKEYPYHVKCKVDAMAASAASVVAMAGDEVLMTPVSFIQIHNPWMIAIGDADDFERSKNMLNEVKEGILNAYVEKTKLSRVVISHMMDEEEMMSAWKAVRLGFADGVVEADGNVVTRDTLMRNQDATRVYAQVVAKYMLDIRRPTHQEPPPKAETEPAAPKEELKPGVSKESLEKRLSLIPH